MSDFDVAICMVTRGQYMAMLNEFRTINPDLRDRVDDPPVEGNNIQYIALVGKFKWEPWPALFGANPIDNFRLGAAWVNTSTGYIGGSPLPAGLPESFGWHVAGVLRRQTTRDLCKARLCDGSPKPIQS